MEIRYFYFCSKLLTFVIGKVEHKHTNHLPAHYADYEKLTEENINEIKMHFQVGANNREILNFLRKKNIYLSRQQIKNLRERILPGLESVLRTLRNNQSRHGPSRIQALMVELQRHRRIAYCVQFNAIKGTGGNHRFLFVNCNR